VSMAHQESRCDSSAESDSSYGIMQINPTYWCGKHGIPADDYQCKKVLIEDPRANIIAGAKIVKELYDQYSVKGVKFNGCEIQRYYYGWEAAVRAYNGLGCNKDYPEQDNYVEEVMTRAGEAFTGGEKVDDTLDEDESIAAKLANLEALKAGKWPIEDTMAFCKSLTGKYSSSKVNRQFVDELCIQNVLDSKKCSDIKGEGIFNLEEDMDTVYVALELKKAEIAGKRNVFFSEKETVSFGFSDLRDSNWPMTDTIKYAGGLKGKYSANDENKFFVDALCSDEILDAAQCDDVKGVGLFDLEEDMMEVTEMLKIRLIKLSKEEVSVGKDMTIQQALSKAKILSDAGREDNSFITDVYDAEYITDQQYDLAIERGMSFLVSVLEANIKEAEEAKETKDSSSTTSETCPEVEVLDSAKSASSAVDKVMATIDELEGKPRFEGSAGCFSSVEFVYDSAGVDFRKCYYSDATGKQYVTGVVTQSADPTKPFYVNTNCEIRDISENRKLNGLEAGDLIDLAYDVEQSHNVIFIEWVNAAEKIAKIFDWNGEAGTYAYSNYDLSDDSHPVYMYRKPFLA